MTNFHDCGLQITKRDMAFLGKASKKPGAERPC